MTVLFILADSTMASFVPMREASQEMPVAPDSQPEQRPTGRYQGMLDGLNNFKVEPLPLRRFERQPQEDGQC